MSRLLAVPITPPVGRKLLRGSGYQLVQKLAWVLLFVWVSLLSSHLASGSTSSVIGTDTPASVTPVARGILTLTSNLRDAPSMKSGVVGIAKERMPVDIIGQTERWYHVRTGDGLEAWIYKPLVLIEPATTPQTETAEVSPPMVVEDRQDTPIAEPAGLAETSPPEVSQEEQEQPPDAGELPASQSAPMEPITAPAEPIAITDAPNLMLETVFEPFQGLVGYLVAALVVVVIVSIWLQLRAARQLRRAMGEMGQILDIVEDIYSEVALSHPSTPEPLPSIPAPNATAALPAPELDFSPLERALLEGLSSGEEIQEGELAKMLQEKGFPGVLIKAVIGDIVRKTAGDGRPWVEVRFTHGRYAYALRLPGGTSEREARQGE